jgi:ribosomal protein S18 acetylase RimI-like enzyme
LSAHEWREYRELRLRALAESPDAFGSVHADEAQRASSDWSARVASGATSALDLPLVAESRGELVGLLWARSEPSEPGDVHLYQMWVAPAARGAGIGRTLLETAIAWAAGRSARRVLLSVTCGDTPAARLYARSGFAPSGDPRPLRAGSELRVQPLVLRLTSAAPGRPLCSDSEAERRGFDGPECARRRAVLRETLAAFERADPPGRPLAIARANVVRWRNARRAEDAKPSVEVLPGDWGEVTHALTKREGTCFAVLNMANAYVPGGAYVEGAVAQEENLFRRTDCHFHIGPDVYDAERDLYRPPMTRLLEARDGAVYLDVERPRVCMRAREDRSRTDLGYAWLPEEEWFPFFELRAAAPDLRDGSPFDADEMRRRIAAQLDTLRTRRVRHAVLGAFGCGAFRNPGDRVARIYREEIAAREADFSVIAFAIFAAGYGPDNFEPFSRELGAR